MNLITWINPAGRDHCKEDPTWKIEVTSNTDHWGNHCRMWVASKGEEDQQRGFLEIVRVHSGTDGVSIATKSWNNGHACIPPSVAKALAEELLKAHKYSKVKQKKVRRILAEAELL